MQDRNTAVMETDLSCGSCCNVNTAIDYLISIDNNTVIHEQTINLLKYISNRQNGAKPKYHKGNRKEYSYWKCGHCGGRKVDVTDRFCPGCGYVIRWDNPACLTGVHDIEVDNRKKKGEVAE